MPNDASRKDPTDTADTVPPPPGAKDVYSHTTRIATLPEDVLAAMRERETDASLASRSRKPSGTRPAVRPAALPLAPALPRFAPVTALPFAAPEPRSGLEPEASRAPSPPPASPWGDLAGGASSPPGERPSAGPLASFPPLTRSVELVRSLMIIGAFALLGGLVAAAITFLVR